MIRAERLGKRFGDRWVLRGVDLEVRSGESIALVGVSGSGKSLLLKLMAGLETPDEGSVRISSENVGMLFQKNALFDSMTVEENLTFPLRERRGLRGAPARALAADFLSRVGLADTQALYPDELSGGMQKRLGIARALIVEPEVILYDEPTAGLDPITSRTIADLIRELSARARSTLVTVTNDMPRAYQLGDRIFLISGGTLLAGGTPTELQATTDPRLRSFIFGAPEADA